MSGAWIFANPDHPTVLPCVTSQHLGLTLPIPPYATHRHSSSNPSRVPVEFDVIYVRPHTSYERASRQQI